MVFSPAGRTSVRSGAPADTRGFGEKTREWLEKKVGDGGAVSLEGAYYDYDHDDEMPAFGYQGNGYYVLASYLTPQKFGIGKLQPHVRYQAVDDDNAPDHDRWELGLGYVIDGQPYVTPTAYWRKGEHVYWHGSSASRMLRTIAAGRYREDIIEILASRDDADAVAVGRNLLGRRTFSATVGVTGRIIRKSRP